MPNFRSRDTEPLEDYGFFGPNSVMWRVWGYPTGLTVGFQRSVVIEELDPDLVAAVDKTKAIRNRPRTRYDRTLRYFAMVAFGDTRSTSKAADILVKVHSKAIGTEPVGGGSYDANDPHSQLWIHMTAWHSILYAYERYGPGRLSPADEDRYWAECATAAELQTIDPADVPRSREAVRNYFEDWRPRLVYSDVATATMDHLLSAEVMLPPMPRVLRTGAWVVGRILRAATIATMPLWMREQSGFSQPQLVDVLVRPVLRIAFAIGNANKHAKLAALTFLSPSTRPVVAPMILGIEPRNPVTLTPAEARECYGYDKPAQAHLEWREYQRKRVFEAGESPSDAGIAESEPILGAVG